MPRNLTQAHVAQFRTRLCDVAARLYFETGHGNFNMRDLAARVGVSAMTPYRYFGDKDGILAAVRVRGLTRLADRLDAAVPQGAATVMQTYISFAMEEAAYYRLIFDLSQPSAPLPEFDHEQRRVIWAMMGAVPAGRTQLQAEMPARALWAALHGAICLVMAGKLSETELGELASQQALMVLGINHRFVVPPIQKSAKYGASAKSGSVMLHEAAAENIAAE